MSLGEDIDSAVKNLGTIRKIIATAKIWELSFLNSCFAISLGRMGVK
jgi:hypothetical protein